MYISRILVYIKTAFHTPAAGSVTTNVKVTILFLQEWRFGRSRSFKVIDFGANRKRVGYVTSC